MIVHNNCLYFKGDIPCLPHKKFGYHCEDCPSFKKISYNILIIKLGAIGDVIRTTPIIRKIRKEYSNPFITWLTDAPEILSNDWIDRILKVNAKNLIFLNEIKFDWLINLDKDPIAISLTKSLNAEKKSGFTIDEFGHAKPIGSIAENHKWITGLFDDINKKNKKHYVEEIFEIAGFDFEGEEYILDIKGNDNWDIDNSKKIIGLNTGCGGRWTSRLWPTEYWIKLSKDLKNVNYEVILLGGEQEDEKNKFIAKESGAKYFGYFQLSKFISLVNKCDIVVTAVTMAMHIAIGLKKNLILFNNIFNKNEFYLYNRGEILEPDFECDCYYTPICANNCMQYLKPEKVYKTINSIRTADNLKQEIKQ